ncbi:MULTISPECIES: hypothetical protein [Photorhabdus]|uniref:hypothetical protein n=1 Tax=Photorhabdus TaxID=29487 RepID=UPI0011BED362|nr:MULTISPECIES: hypothetical protein [Photorhabdus]NDL16413.1 hypothetical protein [Photorhabdus laumondii subsp. laumondii]NDL48765.1 hypothetical protein [Photorhabdus laumondii subsp. laumondii]NDL51022.1 hypothetical protein [Photorhabdus laumondii subsp. laumondii]
MNAFTQILVIVSKIHCKSWPNAGGDIGRKAVYTQWISRCIATARERIPGSIDNYVTGVSERSQQRGNLKDNGYNLFSYFSEHSVDRKLDLKKTTALYSRVVGGDVSENRYLHWHRISRHI